MNIIHVTLKSLQEAYESNDDTVLEQLIIDPELEEYVTCANKQYRDGSPVVSDKFYDNVLVEALKIANPQSDFLSNVEPETEEVFGKTVELPERMLSTNKAYSLDGIEKWANDITKVGKDLDINDIMFKVTPKLDGYASFYDGKSLYTRGNGRQGQDISRALDRGLIVKNGTTGKGEIVVDRQWFSENLSSIYENSRNIISSVIKEGELDAAITDTIKSSSVIFVPFSELECWVGNKEDLLKNLELLWDEFVSDSRFDTDGLVIEAIDENIKSSMGFTNHHYRWQIAYKKNTEFHDIKVIGIIPQTSKSGKITPVVELEPTKVSGVTISRATGHHYGNLIEKGIDIGAIVKVCRSGLVIPYIADVVKPVANVDVPEFCPSCGEPTVLEGDNLLCVNHIDCPAQICGTLEFFFKTIGNCDGFGPKIIERIVSKGANTIPKIYAIDTWFLQDYCEFGEKTAFNLMSQLNRSKREEIEDWRWLAAWSIPNIGKGGCEKLLKNHTIESIFQLTVNDIIKIDGFAEKTATLLVETLAHIKPYVEQLMPMFNLRRTVIGKIVDSSISGKSIVFTGTLSTKRSVLEKQAKDMGAKVGSAVTGKTDFLICGENVGETKTQSAVKHGVKILTESEYLDMIA
jgi:DNA ligase (NAD+)